MKRLKKILFRGLMMGIGFCLTIVAITSTTRFEIQKNPMEHFFAQHAPIDSKHINESISGQLVLEDIDYLVKTIEEVHPNPYYSISKEKFYYLTDSIKQLVQDEIGREDLFNLLKPLIGSLNDGHTCINFPEISKGQDNQSNFKNEHAEDVKLIDYNTNSKSTGYLVIKDFVMDKSAFKKQLNQIFEQIHKDSISDLIIDIRNNPGGNSELADLLTSKILNKPYKSNSKIIVKRSEQYYAYLKGYFSWWFRPFLRFIPQIEDYRNTPIGQNYEDVKGKKSPQNIDHQFKGDKILLINSNTFSTALGFATVFKDNKIGIIIGEPTNAEVNGFGDIYPFDLPNSGLWVWCSSKKFIRPSGEMTKGGLEPDIFVEDTEDKILNFTNDLIRSQN